MYENYNAVGSELVRLHFIPAHAAGIAVDCRRAILSWKTPQMQTGHDG
jgi:hypothetical protein